LQRELLLLVNLKRQSAHTPLRALFDKHRVWQNRRPMIGDALQHNAITDTPLPRRSKQMAKYQLDWDVYDFDWGVTYQYLGSRYDS
ncbi:hypothetical protein MJM04_28970, partial [Salmonella enterica subsp. enterica serovar Cerro]|nr:hypothetical protein [Salmonella enterica subsp. enterica serovar Cerro]